MGICLKQMLLNDRKGSGQILKGEKLRGGRKGAGKCEQNSGEEKYSNRIPVGLETSRMDGSVYLHNSPS